MKKTILLSSIILLTLTGCNINNLENPIIKDTAQITQIQTQSKTQQNSAAQNQWQTYIGKNFEISYPETWTVSNEKAPENIFRLLTKSRQEILNTEKAGRTRVFDIAIIVYNNLKELPLNEQGKLSLKEWIIEYGLTQITPTTIDGINGYKGIVTGLGEGDQIYFLEKNGKIYEIEMVIDTIDKTPTEDQTNILKSFRFIN